MDVSMRELQYSGKEKIILSILKPTKSIRLDYDGTFVYDVFLSNMDYSAVATPELRRSKDTLYLYLPATLQISTYILHLKFKGRISDSKTFGFYASKYTDHEDNNHVMAITQFEPDGARTVFPCFDAPNLKAIFNIEVTVENSFDVISNMAVAELKNIGDNFRTFRFHPTPLLSTYLIAWTIGRLDFVALEIDSTLLRIFYQPDNKNTTEMALDTAIHALLMYQSFYDYKYPNSKLDLFPVPDFTSEGMENFGLITIEDSQLITTTKSTITEKIQSKLLIAHEISHQWFGDLVTIKEWKDLWLNEGFAEYMQYRGIMEGIQKYFYQQEFAVGFKADSSKFTHAIVSDVYDPNTPSNIFDDITYDKSAAILYMLNQMMDSGLKNISESYFKLGLQKYLKEYAFANAETKDLWNVLQSVYPMDNDISRFMNSWIYQPGFPILKTDIISNNYIATLSIEQYRFTLWKDTLISVIPWNIPISYRIIQINSNNTIDTIRSNSLLVTESNATIELGIWKPGYIFYFDSPGFFYNLYSKDLFISKLQIMAINPEYFTCIEKSAFIYETIQLFLSGRYPDLYAIQVIELARNSKSISLWSTLHLTFLKLKGLLNGHQILTDFRIKIWSILPNITISDLLESNTSDQLSEVNAGIFKLGVLTNDTRYTKLCLQIFDNWMNEGNQRYQIKADYIQSIYFIAIQNLSTEIYDIIWNAAIENNSYYNLPKLSIAYLSFTNDVERQDRLIQLLFKKSQIRPQVKLQILMSLVEYTSNGYNSLWIAYMKIWKSVKKSTAKKEADIFEEITCRFKSAADIEKAKELILYDGCWNCPRNDEPLIFKSIRKGLERAESIQKLLN